MSRGRKRQDEKRKTSPISHCAEGHCCNPLRKGFEWASCSRFFTIQKLNLIPFDCPYYKP